MVIAAPFIPSLNDHEIEAILTEARARGAREARHVLLRLPHEVKDLVADWFAEHYPGRQRHAFSLIAGARGGRENDGRYGTRMTGQGAYADLIATRMRLARARLGFARERITLDASAFAQPGEQLALL